MEQIIIHNAALKDLTTLQAVAKQVFFETFAPYNTAENMQKYLEESFSEEKLSAELNNPESFFYMAWDGDAAVGYLKLNTGKAQTEPQEAAALEIERIYVKSEYQGKKVGQLLYHKALEIAKERNSSFLWLGVWEENQRAINFYTKNGFVAFDEHKFKFGDEIQTDIMMKKML